MEKEIITGKHITIAVKGTNEEDINAALEEAFAFTLQQIKRGRSYSSWEKPRKIGNSETYFHVESAAKHVKVRAA